MSETAFVLVVDDNAEEAERAMELLRQSGHACRVVASAEEAIASIRERPPDVVISATPANGDATPQLLARTRRYAPDANILLILDRGEDGEQNALVATDSKAQPYDVVLRPVDFDELRAKVDRAANQALLARQARDFQTRLDHSFSFEGILGASPVLLKEINRAKKLAQSKSTILIFGETGTGKELFAQAIHVISPRRHKPFKVINCAAISESLLESELFGHVRGAFTGAITHRTGILEACDGGTLFLDEIGDMPLSMQAKLLRTLETGEIMPVGSTEVRHVDVRFVAATHRDLNERVKKGEFREDLLYRLRAHCRIRIPPLRERREDIPILIHYFLKEINAENGTNIEGLSPDIMRKLTQYDWPGNVRELKSVLESMVLEAAGSTLQLSDLPENMQGPTDIVPVNGPQLVGWTMADVEKWHVLNTLRLTGGNREKAAKILQIGARTLYRKLKDYGLN